jgi:hypothetical protein
MTRFIRIIVPALIVLAGLSCNVLVTQLNGGMPAKLNYAVPTKHAYDVLNLPYPRHTVLNDGTRLKLLADILPFNFSIGDVLIIGGLVALVITLIINIIKIQTLSKSCKKLPLVSGWLNLKH